MITQTIETAPHGEICAALFVYKRGTFCACWERKAGMRVDQAGKRRGFASRMQNRLQTAKAWMNDHAYLITMGAAVAVIVATGMYTEYLKGQAPNVQAAANAPEVAQSAVPSVRPTVTAMPTIAPMDVGALSLRSGGSTVMPVSGAVVRGYAPQTPVYWEALSCIQVHRGMDIAGEAGENILCVMDGTVREAVRDELWGWRVRVAQMDGSEAIYAGLALCAVMPGEHVTRGETIGVLMDAIPCEAELGAHLHVELTRDGEQADPMMILGRAHAYADYAK